MNRKVTLVKVALVVWALTLGVLAYVMYSTPPSNPTQYMGQATVTSKSMKIFNDAWGASIGHFDLVIRNTGYLPITKAECRIDEFSPIVSDYYIFPQHTLGFTGNFPASESAYVVTVQLTYSDGSTSKIDTIVTVTI
jgi:hypothetical protein